MLRSPDCTGQADPTNLMFYSAGYRALSKVEEYLGWTRIDGDVMHVWDMFQCVPGQRGGFSQRKSDVSNGENYHIRLWDGWGSGDNWGYYTGGGVHKDKEHICWPWPWPQHKAVDFDGPRDSQVLNEFGSHGHAISYMWRDNQDPSPQDCSGVNPDPHGDGWVGTIQILPPSATMSKAPTSANLWICTAGWPYCQGPGEGELALQENVSAVTTFDWDHNDEFDGVGRYQYDVKFDSTKVQVTSQDSGLLTSTGRPVLACGSSWVSGGKRFWCASSGSDQAGPLGDNPDGSSGVVATTWVTPHPSLIGLIRPAQENGLLVNLTDESCDLDDIFSHAVPGSLANGLLPYCYDAAVTVRILEGNVNLDCILDVIDSQMTSYRYGAFYGNPLYDLWYDLEPANPDWDIDIKDLQKVFGRLGSTCQSPIPPQPPW